MRLSVLGGTAITLGLASYKAKGYMPEKIGSNNKINVGLVGCGQRGVDQVLRGIKHLDHYKVVAICDVIPAQMDRVLEHVSNPVKRFLDYRELVAQEDVDMVIVATTLKWHFSVCKAALLANKHVVCEKLMTFDIQEAVELERLVDKTDKLFKVSFEARNNPAYIHAKELVTSGAIGEIIFTDCTWNSRGNWRRKIERPGDIVEFPTGEKISRERLLNWRMDTEFSGDLLGEVVCHPFDSAQWILNSGHAKSAMGMGKTSYWKDGRNSFDNIHSVFNYDNNLVISCNSILSNVNEGYRLSIYGRDATIRLSLEGGVLIPEESYGKNSEIIVDAVSGATYTSKKSEEKKWVLGLESSARDYYGQWEEGYILDTLMGYKALAESIQQNKPSPIPVKDGKHSSIAVHLANRSMREGGEFKWKEEYGT